VVPRNAKDGRRAPASAANCEVLGIERCLWFRLISIRAAIK
jgi:hypothetical protein